MSIDRVVEAAVSWSDYGLAKKAGITKDDAKTYIAKITEQLEKEAKKQADEEPEKVHLF